MRVCVPRALSALPQCAVQLTSGGQELLYQPTRQPPSTACERSGSMHPYGSLFLLSLYFDISARCFLVSFSLSPYISYIPLLFHHLSIFFVRFSLIFLYTCHSVCAVLSGLLSFSPHFFLFLLCLSASVSIPRSCLSVRIPSSLLPLFLKANTASPCPQSKTLLCPLSTVLESHCRPAAQYAQWPRGPTMAHFNLNFPRNEWEPTPVHAACLLIGPS